MNAEDNGFNPFTHYGCITQHQSAHASYSSQERRAIEWNAIVDSSVVSGHVVARNIVQYRRVLCWVLVVCQTCGIRGWPITTIYQIIIIISYFIMKCGIAKLREGRRFAILLFLLLFFFTGRATRSKRYDEAHITTHIYFFLSSRPTVTMT